MWDVSAPRRELPKDHPGRGRIVGIILALLVVVGIVALMFLRPNSSVTPSPDATTAVPSVTAVPDASAAPAEPSVAPAALAGCQASDTDGFVPTRFQLSNPVADEPVLSLGLDADGNIAAPPKDLPRTASWWNQGPRPGSDRGKAVLSIHTYRNGGALGNEMFDGDASVLKPGDLITLTNDDGRKACYEFVDATRVMVADYDPDSDVMVDFNGDPMLVIVICWDFNKKTDEWDSRVFFHAKLVHA